MMLFIQKIKTEEFQFHLSLMTAMPSISILKFKFWNQRGAVSVVKRFAEFAHSWLVLGSIPATSRLLSREPAPL